MKILCQKRLCLFLCVGEYISVELFCYNNNFVFKLVAGLTMETEGFRDLLQQAEQLTAEMDSGTDLPHVERNLAQILEAGQRLMTRTAPASHDASDVKA